VTWRLWPGLLAMSLLTGCAVVSDVAGLAAGSGAGAATGNPAVGFAVGIGVRAGVDELRKYVVRRRQGGEQDAIAAVAGDTPLGEQRAWLIRHSIPVGNAHGELAVVREYATPLATCREVVFTVEDGGHPSLFTTSLCRYASGWKWAAAEPAVGRWGFLQ
jgi:hypothetical protein